MLENLKDIYFKATGNDLEYAENKSDLYSAIVHNLNKFRYLDMGDVSFPVKSEEHFLRWKRKAMKELIRVTGYLEKLNHEGKL